MSTEFQFGKMKEFWRWMAAIVDVDVLNAAELYT